MVVLAIWLLVLGYGGVYVGYCALGPHNGISYGDALSPKLTGGPCHDGSCTSCKSGASTKDAPAQPPASTQTLQVLAPPGRTITA